MTLSQFEPRLLRALLTWFAIYASAIAEEPKALLPVPSDVEQSAAQKTIADIYREDYERAKTPEKKAVMAKRMLADAMATKDDVAGRYVLLRIARDAATQAGNPEIALAAIAELGSAFKVDVPLMKADALRVAAAKSSSPEVFPLLFAEADSLMGALVLEDRYEPAKALLQALLPQARKLKDPAALKRITFRIKEVEETEKEYLAAKASLAVLATNARDPDANLTVGKFHCFVKGDWMKGLAHLALCSDKELAALAASELSEKPDRLALADAWWVRAEKAEGISRSQLQRHAVELYRRIAGDLRGLTKAKVERRLAEIDKKAAADLPIKPKVVDKDGPASLELKKLADLDGHNPKSGMSHLAFSPDGRLLAEQDGATIIVRDVAKREAKSRLTCSDRIQSLAWSHDGQSIAAGCSPNTIEVWSVSEAKRFATMEDAGFMYVSFSMDDTLIGATMGSSIRLWRPTGKLAFSPRGERLAFSPTQKMVAVVGENKITIASYQGGGEVIIDVPEGNIRDLKYLPDGRTLALLYLGSNSRIDLLDLAQRQIKSSIPLAGDAFELAVSSDGCVIAAIVSKSLFLWNVRTGRELYMLGDPKPETLDDDVFRMGFSSDGKTLAICARKGVQIWEMTYGRP